MTTPETPPQDEQTNHAAPDADANTNAARAHVAAPDAAPGAQADAKPHANDASHASASDDASAPHDASASSDGDGGDAGESDGPAPGNEKSEGEGAEANAGGAQTSAGTSGSAKRRRRRKKRGGGAHAGAPGTEGATPGEGGATEGAEGQAAADGAEPGNEKPGDRVERKREKSKRPPRPERERPAFNVGDVVFGKITGITDDALLIDLSGKANAIFDLRELLLPADDENEPPPPEPEDAKVEDAKAAEAHVDASVPVAEGTEAGEAATAAQAAPQGEPGHEAAVEGESAHVPDGATAKSVDENDHASTNGSTNADASSDETANADAAPTPTEGEPEAAPHKDPPLPQVTLEIGAQFVGVVHNDGGRGGLMVLTHHPKRVSKSKVKVAQALKDRSLVQGLVTGVIKGGVEVDVEGLRAFVPGSHMDLRLGADLSHAVTKRLDFFVTQYAKRGRDVVLSRKPLLEAEAKKAREEALQKLSVGAVMEGTVRSVVPFGAFVDVGGIEGLVPLQEMSHNRSDGPSDVFKAGEQTQVKVLKIDDKGKVWLSRKATIPDPWGEVAKKYAVGTKHAGKVVRIQPFGAFVELESGVDGLIHAADMLMLEKGMSGMKRVENPADVVKVGDAIDVVVAHLETGTHKIGLHPALTGALVEETPQKVQQYKMVKAVVVGIESGGIFVRLRGVTGRGARGYVSAAATGTPRGTELRKPFPVGKEIEAKVLEVDPKSGEAKLSIKALAEESERNAYQAYRQQVKTAARFTFADLLAKKDQKQK